MSPDEEWEHLGKQLDQLGDELREFWSRSERSAEDLRVFNQQYLLRMDRIHLRSNEVIELVREESRKSFADAAAESRAQRGALFRILDKLDRRDDEAA